MDQMDELNKLEINNQKQIKKLDSLWHELADLKLQFKKRNHIDKKCYEDYFTYTIILQLIQLLNYKELLKLRLLNKNMNEKIQNYLLDYRREKKQYFNIINAEIKDELDQLPEIESQIFKEQVLRSYNLRKTIISQMTPNNQNILYFNDSIVIFQIAQCEGWDLQKIQSYHIKNLRNSLIFLDFSKFSEEYRKQLLQFYENKIQGVDQTNSAFYKFVRLWLKQSFYVRTYPQFSKIMNMMKKGNLIKKEINLLKNLKHKNKVKEQIQN